MLTQLVTGCCCCLEDKTFLEIDTVGNGVLLLFGGQDFLLLLLEILGGGGC